MQTSVCFVSNRNAKGFWSNTKNHRSFFDGVGELLGLKRVSDWYNISKEDVEKLGGRHVFPYYHYSLAQALQETYPEVEWQPWRFGKVKNRFWDDLENQHKFLQWISCEMELHRQDDWYKVTKHDLLNAGGSTFLQRHGDSMYNVLEGAYPELFWQPWRFETTYFANVANQRTFFASFAEHMQIRDSRDWYRVSAKDVVSYGGSGLLQLYDGSLARGLRAVYPAVNWQAWRFYSQEEVNRHRHEVNELGIRLGIVELKDWLTVTEEDIIFCGGAPLLQLYDNSLWNLLETTHPEAKWQPWTFVHLAERYWASPQNHRKFMGWLACECDIEKTDDWYDVPQDVLSQHGGVFLETFYGSRYKTLYFIFTEVLWQPWRFVEAAAEYWSNGEHYLSWLAHKLNLKTADDWYVISQKVVVQEGGLPLLSLHEGFIGYALRTNYPEYSWQLWRFSDLPKDFWTNASNKKEFFDCMLEKNDCNELREEFVEMEGQPGLLECDRTHHNAHREFFDALGRKLGLKSREQWYGVPKKEVVIHGGSSILQCYDNSLVSALQEVYCEVAWQPWKFAKVPDGFWDQVENRISFLEQAAKELEIRVLEDWLRVNDEEIERLGGFNLLRGETLCGILEKTYPYIRWQSWKFARIPSGYWNQRSNCLKFMDHYAQEKNVSLEGWYSVDKDELCAYGGRELLFKYGDSMYKLLQDLYPHFKWHEWNFYTEEEKKAHYHMFRKLEHKLNVYVPSDWYGVTQQQVYSHPEGKYLLGKYDRSLLTLLQVQYPTQHWDVRQWGILSYSKSQQLLYKTLRQIFPSVDMEMDATLPSLKYEGTHKNMQLDVWIPSLHTAFEYQGHQHYREGLFGGNFHQDEEKRIICQALGINLITIPYWWDWSIEQLLSTLQKYNVVSGREQKAIVESPYSMYDRKKRGFPFLGNEYFEHASGYEWNRYADPVGWWATVPSEGVRIISDGKGRLYTKRGDVIYAPLQYNLPTFPLDMLLCVNNNLLSARKLVETSLTPTGGDKTLWMEATLIVVDAPMCEGDLAQRIEYAIYHTQCPDVRFLKYWKLMSFEDLEKWKLENREVGLIIREHQLPYIQGKSSSWLKVKAQYRVDGQVIEHHPKRNYLRVKLNSGENVWVQSKVSFGSQKEYFPIGSAVQILFNCSDSTHHSTVQAF